MNGSSSGNVKAVGNFDATSTALSMDIKMTFTNYSDDNKLFLGGPLDITYNVDVANPATIVGITARGFTLRQDKRQLKP